VAFCGRATSLSPRPVLLHQEAERRPCAREAQVRARGRTREPLATIAAWVGARASVPATRREQGLRPPRSLAFRDAVRRPCSAHDAGASQHGPVRRRAHPRCSLSRGEPCPSRTRCGVAPSKRPRGPMYGPRWSRLCPSRVFAPSGCAIAVRPACLGGTRPPLRRRPT
jgi:hypothetical protein